MPRVIEAETDDTLGLGDLVEMLETQPFDARDEDCFASWGPALKRLANNRRFLTDLVIDELKVRCEGQLRANQYTPQVIVLHGRSTKFFMRANFWPSASDSIVQNSGISPFFYGIPHDHNFSFLTVGYLGSGYWSDYYEYDYETVTGYPGEPVELRFVEKARLDRGKVMLYRAHRDIHLQLPADDMSISLNIMEASHSTGFRDQYRFDLAGSKIAGLISTLSLEPLLALSAHFGGDKGQELLETFATGHPSERIRFKALKAQASACAGVDQRIALFERAAASDQPFFSRMARLEVETLEATRGWIETPPRSGALQPA